MSRERLLNAAERLRLLLTAAAGVLTPTEHMEARLALLGFEAVITRGPVLALPWRQERVMDGKMRAANDWN